MAIHDWYGVNRMVQQKWTCGYCGIAVGGNLGFYKDKVKTDAKIKQFGIGPHIGSQLSQQQIPQLPEVEITPDMPRIVICPSCEKPTFFEGGKQVPGVAYGKPVKHLPPELDEIYTEARNCMSVNAFIPAVLTARTILMHIAVEQGAAEGQKFAVYVDHLVSKGFVPPNAKKWIDHVRTQGNAATHSIQLMNQDDAEKVLRFIEMILLFLYEYPND